MSIKHRVILIGLAILLIAIGLWLMADEPAHGQTPAPTPTPHVVFQPLIPQVWLPYICLDCTRLH